ncbi:protein Sly1p [[Candida] jaroonii]|uniref:Protein Sly1p n=1 Tax=[Candida] jaroonii TaxID=467808 RepID=A0ACA9YE22_9ASCO|nr:protein Sly1p [[Candida] jaroonii]
MSLRSKQIQSLERMLHLNQDGQPDLTLASKTEEIIWKALVLDKKSQSIVSSVLRVNDLLRCGITIHQLITTSRSPLPDAPAIYFVEPTKENILLIIEDLRHDTYDQLFINFTASIDRELLESFAKEVSLIGKSHKIKQVFDQYLNFIVTEPNLFSLDYHHIFTKFNHPTTTEDDINGLANDLSNGLLSLILTAGDIPIIRCQRNGPAEFIAQQLDTKLRDYLSNTKNLAPPVVSKRSVMVIMDRNIDLSSMFHHSWIYQCMISDVFNLKRNTITLPDGKNYDIDPKDFFWSKNSQLPFPDVVENANLELETYKHDAQQLTAKTGITSLNDIDPSAPHSTSDTVKMQQAVDALPELTARKATLDMHMDVLASLLKELESKSLDKFFEVETNYNNPKITTEFMDLLNDQPKKDNIIDKLRTFIILFLVCDLPQTYIVEVKAKFQQLDPSLDLSCLQYFEKFKNISRLSSLARDDEGSDDSININNNSALFNNLSSRLYGLTEGKLSEGLSSLTSGLKKLLPQKKNLPLTNIVEAIMDPTNANSGSVQLTDDYLYLDPKSRGGHSKPPKRQSYDEALVFVVGGGNYLEYQNLQEFVVEKGEGVKSVVYGSSNIMSAVDFLQECNSLGKL